LSKQYLNDKKFQKQEKHFDIEPKHNNSTWNPNLEFSVLLVNQSLQEKRLSACCILHWQTIRAFVELSGGKVKQQPH
jgi:hypothetical protein